MHNGTDQEKLRRILNGEDTPFKVTLFDRIMFRIVGYSALWLICYWIISSVRGE